MLVVTRRSECTNLDVSSYSLQRQWSFISTNAYYLALGWGPHDQGSVVQGSQ